MSDSKRDDVDFTAFEQEFFRIGDSPEELTKAEEERGTASRSASWLGRLFSAARRG